MEIDEKDPEFERLMGWYMSNKSDILNAFDASEVDLSTDAVVLRGANGNIIKTIKEKPNDPCGCGSGKKYKRCCGTLL